MPNFQVAELAMRSFLPGRRTNTRLECRKVAGKLKHLFNSLPAVVTNRVPSDLITAFVMRNIFGRRLQWKMRYREGDIRKERLLAVLRFMLLQEINHVI